jgi:hypothetical protein
MSEVDEAVVIDFPEGDYRYIQSGFQYSGGVAAQPGFEIERAQFSRPIPLAEGFAAVEARLKSIARPTTAFAACELRSPAPFTEQGFLDFNKQYVTTLERWGVYRDGKNPVARSNVCPEHDKPAVPSLYAFSYTVPVKTAGRSFVISGGAEAPGKKKTYAERIVALGDVSPEGMRAKVKAVMTEMERRLRGLGFSWADAISTRAYTVRDIGALVGPEIFARGAGRHGLNWCYCRPPVVGLEYEMDVRSAREISL